MRAGSAGLVIGALIALAALAACTHDEDTVPYCDGHGSCECYEGAACDLDCDADVCSLGCDAGALCNSDCSGADVSCAVSCADTSSCDVDCANEACTVECSGSASCHVTACAADRCSVTCAISATGTGGVAGTRVDATTVTCP